MNPVECFPRDALKQYLAGWMDEAQADTVERHLQSCAACEQTVIELESRPDTVLAGLRQGGLAAGTADPDPAVADAVARAEMLMPPAPLSLSPPRPSASVALGPYDLIRELGHGGMGAVYLARHRKLGKQVAIKLLPATWAANEEAAARFRREVMAVGKLDHASIVSATDAGEQDGVHYLVMEYVEGIDLSRLARCLGRLEIPDACEVARQVALGLAYAHGEGIVHRDVKPSNIMLSPFGRVTILDFGLAQLTPWDEASADLTSVGQLMGTLDYMAPEQAERPGGVDYRADLYSLGATLFRLLAGRAPLAAAPQMSPLEKLRLLGDHSPPRLDTLRPDTPAELVALVGTLLARRPEARPASAAHVAEQLAPFCQGSDLVALAARAREALERAGGQAAATPRSTFPASGLPALNPRSGGARHRRLWPAWLALACLIPPLLAAAVLIVLELRKGQLVIESEVPGVQIKLLSGGKAVEEFRVDTGASATRLAADRYEIVLDSPSDSITVDKTTFVLKSGDTVVARVRRREAPAPDAPPTTATAPAPAPPVSEPYYDGKPLSEWLRQLARDRSPKAISESLSAIEAMVDEDTADPIVGSLVATLPDLEREIGSGRNSTNVDGLAFSILARARPGRAYFELLVTMLESDNVAWGRRVLGTGPYVRGATTDELEPLWQWIETRILGGTDRTRAPREWTEPSARLIRAAMHGDGRFKTDGHAVERRFLPQMARSEELQASFWLATPPAPNWSPSWRWVVSERALQILRDSASPPPLVAQSAMILTKLLESEAESIAEEKLAPEAISSMVRSRIEGLAADLPRMWQLVDVEPDFRLLVAPPSSTIMVRTVTTSWTTVDGRREPIAKASETLELLDLAAVLKARGADHFPVTPMVMATTAQYLRVARSLPRGSNRRSGMFPPGIGALVEWPPSNSANFLGSPFGRGGLAEKLEPADWLGYWICSQSSELGGIPLPKVDEEAEPPSAPPRSDKR